MTPAERIRKLIEDDEDHLASLERENLVEGIRRINERLVTYRECLAIVEEAERARDDT